jgi:hypothetical protein
MSSTLAGLSCLTRKNTRVCWRRTRSPGLQRRPQWLLRHPPLLLVLDPGHISPPGVPNTLGLQPLCISLVLDQCNPRNRSTHSNNPSIVRLPCSPSALHQDRRTAIKRAGLHMPPHQEAILTRRPTANRRHGQATVRHHPGNTILNVRHSQAHTVAQRHPNIMRQPAQNGYMPRAQNSALMYNASQTPQVGGVSPLKATPAPALSAFNARSAHNTPVAGGQARSSYYGPSQYGTPQASTPSTTFGGLPANPQQMMIERQQAQAAAQSQARLAAQSSFSSSSSYNGQANGTTMST